MIPATRTDIQTTAEMGGLTSTNFTVSDQDTAKLVSILTDLYKNPALAVAREYLTNAIDATIQAAEEGSDWRPVEVTLPGPFQQSLIIRDYGVGMSQNDFDKVYSRFLASTKEGTNAQAGMLGLGSKSALSYTSQFLVTSWHGGMCVKVLIARGEDGVPTYTIVDTRASDEPTGVEISVPARSRSDFRTEILSVAKWLPVGTVLVNGQEPAKHDYNLLSDGLYYKTNNGGYYNHSESYVIMGNVAYPVSCDQVPALRNMDWVGFAAYIPMGSVDFPPSRETLLYSPRTKVTLEVIAKRLEREVLQHMRDEFSNAPSTMAAINVFNGWSMPARRKLQRDGSLVYKGTILPESIEAPHRKVSRYGKKVLEWDKYVSLPQVVVASTVIITDMPEKTPAKFRDKLNAYMHNTGRSYQTTLVFEGDPTDFWLSEITRIKAADIIATKVAYAPRTTPKEGYTFLRRTKNPTTGLMGTASEDSTNLTVPAGYTLFYFTPANRRPPGRSRYSPELTFKEVLTGLGEKFIGVELGANRVDKFLRAYPQAKTVQEAARIAYEDASNVVKKEGVPIDTSTLDLRASRFLANVSPEGVLDPVLAQDIRDYRASKISQGKSPAFASARTLYNFCTNTLGLSIPAMPTRTIKTVFDVQYPLVGAPYHHAVWYTNMVYRFNAHGATTNL